MGLTSVFFACSKEISGLSVCADRAQRALLTGDPKKEIPRAKKTKSHPKNRSLFGCQCLLACLSLFLFCWSERRDD
jgi:hypothetical protein